MAFQNTYILTWDSLSTYHKLTVSDTIGIKMTYLVINNTQFDLKILSIEFL